MLLALMHEVVMERLPPALSGSAWTLHDMSEMHCLVRAVKHDAVVEQERRQKEREDEAARREAERIAKTPINTAGQDAAVNVADSTADVVAPEEPAADHITSTEPAVSGGYLAPQLLPLLYAVQAVVPSLLCLLI